MISESGREARHRPHLFFGLGFVLAAFIGATCGWFGIPFTLETLAARSAKMHATYVNPAEVNCRPVSIRLTASSDVLQTTYTFNAYLENWRGELVMSVRGWTGTIGCPATSSPEWAIEPPVALIVQPHFPNYAEAYPGPGDYRVTVAFKLSDKETLRQTKTLHIPKRRTRQDELARRILAGPAKYDQQGSGSKTNPQILKPKKKGEVKP